MTSRALRGSNAIADVSRPALFGALSCLLMANALAPSVFQHVGQHGLGASALDLFGIGAAFPIAAYAIWSIAAEPSDEPLRRFDWTVAALVVLAILVPTHLAAKAATLPLGAYLLLTSPKGQATHRIGFITMALTGAFIWGALILTALAAPVLAIDAWLVRLVSGAPVDGNMLSIDGARYGVHFNTIVVMRGCSSLRHASEAIILWASLVQLFKVRITRSVALSCVAAVLAMIAMNVARIALIVAYPNHLSFLHDGLGSTMIGLLALVAAFGIIGSTLARQPRATPA